MKTYVKNGKIVPMDFKIGDIFEFKLKDYQKAIGIATKKTKKKLYFEALLKGDRQRKIEFKYLYVDENDTFEYLEVLVNLFGITKKVKLKNLPRYFWEV